MCSRGIQLGLRHGHGTAGLIQAGLTEEALPHQPLCAIEIGAGRHQHGFRLGDVRLCGQSAGAAQTVQPRLGLPFIGLGLCQGGLQFPPVQPDQHVCGSHLGALVHHHLTDPARQGAADLDA